MALWRLFYHVVWATKNRQPLIDYQWEETLYRYMLGKADSLSCVVHAVNGMTDHIHVVASIPPTLAIADFVKNIKGSSAHYINHEGLFASQHFAWQAGYGVFSLGQKQLDKAVAYVENQKIHHREGSLIKTLEEFQTGTEDAVLIKRRINKPSIDDS